VPPWRSTGADDRPRNAVGAAASGQNEAYVRSLGVDEFIDRTTQPFEQVARDMDVVFDTVGGDIFQRAFHILH
jgi:NADPH:quinone reductase-like Zn-dependent oxidoreductase